MGLFNASAIDYATKESWCQNQIAVCDDICANATYTALSNSCYPTSLDYSCTCSNGFAPNATLYSLTIPYFECIYQVQSCVHACPQADGSCTDLCYSGMPWCGAAAHNGSALEVGVPSSSVGTDRVRTSTMPITSGDAGTPAQPTENFMLNGAVGGGVFEGWMALSVVMAMVFSALLFV
ncbi:hypothetical protein SAICODRAFT_161754 [Saitoella complicata NRRL Y-17804]|uniref:uncharacterized protein n=1 Tax=Saitoella complicata (strain BCRC 22490 / CBS 7301 / JCM 7358 / NBRC 10748 / NRRL Y-17804) TaxID=698492 RepID=UPI00086793EC|nr:uncharacterized protein SAICODRAFT_161754 [Saitoella complicata NRRL Y-17804]ODQ51026.1 hypothetical protein SAICODRAFT_161754 [Saitoella complicata NRRL Y-17804]